MNRQASDSSSPSSTPLPGEAIVAARPDAGVMELGPASPADAGQTAAPPGAGTAPTNGTPGGQPPAADLTHDTLFRAGTLVYTSAGVALLFFWLLWGDFALSMRDRSVGPVVQLFLKSLHASDFTMTMLMTFLPPAIGLVLSPIISYKSDRLRSRWGRRIPFLLIPTPIAALAMIGIAFSTDLGAMLHGAFGAISQPSATLAIFACLWTIFEVAIIISGSVLAGLINDVVPRGRLGRFYGLFRAISLIDGMIFNWFLLKYAESHFTLMFVLIAAVFGIGFVTMCLTVKEGQYPPPAELDDPRARGFWGAAKLYFRECFSQPYYLWCFTAMTVGTLTFVPFNTFSIYYAKQLNMDLGFYGQLVTYSYCTSLCLAYSLGWLVDRFHALRVGMVAMLAYAGATLWGFLYTDSPGTFGVALVAHVVLSGTYFTATASLSQALLPRSRFAQFASAGGMLTSVTLMLLGPTLGLAMDWTQQNYRLTFGAGFVLSLAAIALMLVVYRHFLQHGGHQGYVAPGDEGLQTST